MCRDQIWRMTSGTPMVRRPAGVANSRCPGTITAQAHGGILGAAHRVVAVKVPEEAMATVRVRRMDPGVVAAMARADAEAAQEVAVLVAAVPLVPTAHFLTSTA
jgi:hypothetical protein